MLFTLFRSLNWIIFERLSVRHNFHRIAGKIVHKVQLFRLLSGSNTKLRHPTEFPRLQNVGIKAENNRVTVY